LILCTYASTVCIKCYGILISSPPRNKRHWFHNIITV